MATGRIPINGTAAIQSTIVDAKGDIIAATAADTVSRLAVGANDTVLTADSSTATGLKWAAPAAGGMTLLSTTTLSGATTTISSIPSTYINLFAIFRDQTSGDNTALRMRINSDTTSSSHFNIVGSGVPNNPAGNTPNNYYQLGEAYSVGTNYEFGTAMITFFDYANTTGWKIWSGMGLHTREGSDSTTSPRIDLEWGGYTGGSGTGDTSAISSLTFFPSTGSGLQGTVLLYGVK
jgi:hypothetical protein